MIVWLKTWSSRARQGGGAWSWRCSKGGSAKRIGKHWTLPRRGRFLQGASLGRRSLYFSAKFTFIWSQQIVVGFLGGNLPAFLSSSGGPMPHVILFPNQLPAISTDNFYVTKNSRANYSQI